MKLCIIGNSHLACIKTGWDKIAGAHSDIEPVFFGAPVDHIRRLVVKPSKRRNRGLLVPRTKVLRKSMVNTSGGLNQIKIQDYDAILLFGMFLTVPLVHMKLSAAVRAQVVRDSVHETTCYQTIEKVREISTKVPVFVGHDPLQARQLAENPNPPLDADLFSYDEAFAAMEAELAETDVTLLAQPAETIGAGLVTQEAWSKGSSRLDIGTEHSESAHAGLDIRHMNAEYGALFLETHLPAIRAVAAPSEAA